MLIAEQVIEVVRERDLKDILEDAVCVVGQTP